MVNVDNPDYEMCLKNGYLLKDSFGVVRPLKWWHGYGALLDYSNPDAVSWWHSQMDQVLDVGVDGFKCDGTDPYVLEYSILGGAYGYNNTLITYRDYADMYYRDFLYYTREKRSSIANGDAGLIMSRPIDCLVDGVSKVCMPFSPKDVMFSGWVGDDDASFNGFRGCMRKVIYSAWSGYANFGCDIGGYRGNSDSMDKELFIRWAQFGSFVPLMENGGGGEHRPWMYDEETVNIYRKFAKEHHRLAPYLHTVGANAVDNGVSSITPVAQRTTVSLSESEKSALSLSKDHQAAYFPEPSTYSYILGDSLLVHPVIYEVNGSANAVNMVFPDIDNAATTWLYWWKPYDLSLSQSGGNREVKQIVPLSSYPVYVRKGSLLPLESYTSSKNIIFNWFCPSGTDSATANMRESDSDSTGNGLTASISIDSTSSQLQGSITAHKTYSSGFEIIGVTEPTSVNIVAPVTSLCDYSYEPRTYTLRLQCANIFLGVTFTVSGVQTR